MCWFCLKVVLCFHTANDKHKLGGRQSRDKLDASAQGYPQKANWGECKIKMNIVTRGSIDMDNSGNIDVEPTYRNEIFMIKYPLRVILV